MVHLDHQLIFDARRFMTGADVHRVKEMIFVYQQAVELHNGESVRHLKYQPEHEARLRCYVVRRQVEAFERKITAARQYSTDLSEINKRLQGRTAAFDALYDQWQHGGFA